MFRVMRHRDFTLLWTGGLISMIGNWMLLAAIPFYVYQVTESALATSATLMAYIAPGVIFSSLAGVFVDRWDRKRVMVIGNLLQMLVVSLMLFIRSPEWIWVIYVATFLEATISHFVSPAENALLPTLVPEEELISANSLNSMNDNLARLVGPAIGGALLALVGFSSVILIDAVTYAAAAMMISLVSATTRPAVAQTDGKTGLREAWRRFWRDWLSGLRYIKQVRILAYTFSIVAFALLGDAIISALLVVFIQDEMGLSSVEFGWMMTARGIGGLFGGLLLAQIGQKLTQTGLVAWGLMLSGGLIMLMVLFPTLAVVLPLLILAGITAIGFLIGSQTILQTESEEQYRGRVFGAYGTTLTLLMLIGSGLAGLLADRVGSIPLMTAAAIIFILAGVLAFLLYGRRQISLLNREPAGQPQA